MSTLLVLLRGQAAFRVERPRSWQSEAGGWLSAYSSIHVCPHCRRTWAELYFEDDPEDWHPAVIGAYCEEHKPAEAEETFKSLRCVPGSLFPSGWTLDLPLLAALPEALLRREIELTFKHTGEQE